MSQQTIRTKTTGITQRPGTIRASPPLWRFSNITRVTLARRCRALALRVHSVMPSSHGNVTHTSLSILVLASTDRTSNRPCHGASATSGCGCSRQTCRECALGANNFHVLLGSTAIGSCLPAPLTCASGRAREMKLGDMWERIGGLRLFPGTFGSTRVKIDRCSTRRTSGMRIRSVTECGS
jgi:hypothetical protein